MLLAAVLIFLAVFLLMWWAFGPEKELHIDRDNDYEIRSLYPGRKDRR